MRKILVLVLLSAACAINEKERVVQDAIHLDRNMCAKKGVAAYSNDPKGKRMVCEVENPTGSNYGRCVCRDEQAAAENRRQTQQQMLDWLQHDQILR